MPTQKTNADDDEQTIGASAAFWHSILLASVLLLADMPIAVGRLTAIRGVAPCIRVPTTWCELLKQGTVIAVAEIMNNSTCRSSGRLMAAVTLQSSMTKGCLKPSSASSEKSHRNHSTTDASVLIRRALAELKAKSAVSYRRRR